MTQSLPFQQLMPGLGQLQALMQNAFKLQQGAGHQTPLGGWLQPPLTQEQIESRIAELRTVLYWLEQNVHAVKATIEALEVQRLTFSALAAMNVNISEMAKAFRMPDLSGKEGAGDQSGDGKPDEARPDAAAGSEALDPAAWLRPWAQVFAWPGAGGNAPSDEKSAAEPEPSVPVTPRQPQPSRAEQPAPPPTQATRDRLTDDGADQAEGEPTATSGAESAPLQWWQTATRQFQALASSALENPKAVEAWVQAGQRAQQAISTGAQDVVAALNEAAKVPLKGAAALSESMAATGKKASRAAPRKATAKAGGEGAHAARKGSTQMDATAARPATAKPSLAKNAGGPAATGRSKAASAGKVSSTSRSAAKTPRRSAAVPASKARTTRSTGTARSPASAPAAGSKAKSRSAAERRKP